MKNVCLNKKGFTLVELLAVIVILALLIVITANTVLPMMNKSKQNAMVVYAERVLSNAAAEYQADSITLGNAEPGIYSITRLMGGNNEYVGCVKVERNGDNYKYSINMYDHNNQYSLEKADLTSGVFEDSATDLVDPNSYDSSITKDSFKADSECDGEF